MGLEINFDDIFLPKTFDLINKLESYLDVDITKVDWESEQYDLYGKISNFEKVSTNMMIILIYYQI